MRQKKEPVGKVRMTVKANVPHTQPDRLRKWESIAQIITSGVLLFTFVVGVCVALITYFDYQAKARPYLAVQNLKLNQDKGNSVWLLIIDVTNLGERPATDISIQHLEVCARSPESCTQIEWTPVDNQKDTIVFPGRINVTRISITEADYQNILKTETLVVNMLYRFGDKEYGYEATMRLQSDSNIWSIEGERYD